MTQLLLASFDGLRQGLALVDHSRDRATINAAAAGFLGLPEGEHRAGDVTCAIARLNARAIGTSQPPSNPALTDAAADVEYTWKFSQDPTVLRVSSRHVRTDGVDGRVWIFTDISVPSNPLGASESARTLLQVNADAMPEPQTLLEAVRDPGGRVVDFACRSANRSACVLLGVDEADLVGQTILTASIEAGTPDLMAYYVQCLEQDQPVTIVDLPFPGEDLDTARRFDIRVTPAGEDLISVTWREVTDRFLTAQRMAGSEQAYRLLEENIGEVVCHVRGGCFALISGPAEDVLGAPAAAWIGRAVEEIIPPEESIAYTARVEKLAKGGVIKERARLVGVDGVVKWVHLRIKPFRDAQGSMDGYAVAFRLIEETELEALRAAEEARRNQIRAEERYRRSMDDAAIGMCLITPDGRFADVNNALCQLFGYDAETLKQKTWQELTAPEYLAADQEKVDDILEGRLDSYRMVKQYIGANGRLIWGDLSVSCIRDENGRVENFISQIMDISVAVQADRINHQLAQRLQDQSDRMAAELESAAVYMSSIMPRGLTGDVAVSSHYIPTQELGGDCFHYSWIDDDHLQVYLIDVSGHGIEPALLSVSLHNMLRSGSLAEETLRAPEVVAGALNRLFQMEEQGDHYFTMWYGIYAPSSRTLRYTSAGAPPALAFNSTTDDGVEVTELSTHSLPVGMFEDSGFEAYSYTVPAGCRILIYSDGASEIPLRSGRTMTLPEFRDVTARFAESKGRPLDDLVEELRALTPAGKFSDDCSLIQLEFD